MARNSIALLYPDYTLIFPPSQVPDLTGPKSQVASLKLQAEKDEAGSLRLATWNLGPEAFYFRVFPYMIL
jgi:hypothetical protein